MKLRNGPFTGGVCEFPMTCTSIEGFDRRCGQSPKGHLESEEFAGAGLRFESGAMGSLHASTAQFSGALESIFLSGSLSSARLVGGELTIEYINGQSESVGEASSGGGTADPMVFSHEWHQRLITDFLDALDCGCEPTATLSQALEAHKLIDALMLSASSKRHVCLNTIGASL
jgi:UDP-N-acetyl-2-amino-2-deoxyglucuronate dehydrogenase